MGKTQLHKKFNTGSFNIGASILKQALWYFTSVFFFESKIIPSSAVLVFILRCFGAQIGKEVRIKPGIYIKYPWKLFVDDFSWLADCYIDNLTWVKIGKNCCISQKATLITGNHDYKKSSFDLIVQDIVLADGAWIGARASVCPGVIVGSHAILCMGSVANANLKAYGIYQGNPAELKKDREIDTN